ncbi:acyl-CoA thioesterase [Metallococcus carri]|uniref:acyl-CoA thioesterase n=1 Tax=Metallococcus carri TaxID=1656884 RepID=UPI002E2C1627|nr:acyl-CoA thioesterase II [Metallococcus carri]
MTSEPANSEDVDPVRTLLEVLDLEPAGTTPFGPDPSPADLDEDDVPSRELELFVGRSQITPHKRVFGGQVLAQSLIAAGRSVQAVDGLQARRPHSLHAYFIRPGDSLEPIRFAVENLRDGNSFSVRRVFAMQKGRTILSATLSFQEPADGLDHQAQMPSTPDPDRVRTTAEELKGIDHPAADHWRSRAIDVRTVEGALYYQPGRQHNAHQNVWMRCAGPLPDDPLLHTAILAYASDYTLLESVLRRHGMAWADRRLRVASLDHAMWFHRPVRIDNWVLYQQESPSASGGRGLGLGKIFGLDGTLVASVAQEGMVRVKQPE